MYLNSHYNKNFIYALFIFPKITERFITYVWGQMRQLVGLS